MTKTESTSATIFHLFDEQEELDPAKTPVPALWRILIRPMSAKKITAGGIHLPDQGKEAEEYNNMRGQVIAMGPLAFTGDRFRPHPDASPIPGCKVGDWVTYGKYGGQKLTVDGVKLHIINDDEVTSVVPDPKAVAAYV